MWAIRRRRDWTPCPSAPQNRSDRTGSRLSHNHRARFWVATSRGAKTCSNVICVPFYTAGCLQSCLALNGRNHPHTTLSVFCMNVGCLPKMESIAIPKLNRQEQS